MMMTIFIFGMVSYVQAQDSKGNEFWICFPGNLSVLKTQLFITADAASTVTIDIPGIAFNTVVAVPAGGLQTVEIPATAQVQSSFIPDNKGIHITATTEVTVYGMNAQTATTDAFLGFPLDAIGSEYYVLGYNRDFGFPNPTQATIVATQNNTTVTITSSITGGPFTVGLPTSIVLNQGQVYQLRSNTTNADYTGTKISSDRPISVFGGAQCTNISGSLRACDHLVEQLPPLSSWGKSFLTVPLATRTGGDVFRFMAQTNGSTINVNGVLVATLNAGEFFETILGSASYNRITSNQPILVGQYSRSSGADNVTSDPFFALVPPDEQFLNAYTISAGTENIPNNWINITSPTSNTASVQVDGVQVTPGLWIPIPATTFSGAKVPVSVGVHRITSGLPIGALVYGFGSYDSYGYLGGQSFSPIATVSSLVLTPELGNGAVNTEHCWDALVTDQFNVPVVGVRVDFNITGPNSGSTGFAFTNAGGIAHFCYIGTVAGDDAIAATVGSVSDNASFTWTDGCDINITAKKFYDLNSNGLDDDNLPVPNWSMSLSGIDENNNPVGPISQLTGADGTTVFTGLAKGTYTITEGSQAGWIHTTPTSSILILTNCINPSIVLFGNVCLGSGGNDGKGKGFWTNKNGQALLTGNSLCALNALCLRNADGSNFDPISGCPAPSAGQVNAGKTSLKNWLKNAYATNMSYMLSAQLATLKLNVVLGYVNGTSLIYAPGINSANSAGFAIINDVMAEADAILCANPIISAGNPLRVRAEAVKDATEGASSNNNFVELTPCTTEPPAMVSYTSRQALISEPLVASENVFIKASPNPTKNYFSLTLVSSNMTDRISLRVFDLQGRIVESHNRLKSGQTIQVAGSLRPGTYLIETIQGTDRKTQKVIKL